MRNDDLDRALAQLSEEQRHLRNLSADYARIQRSRFFALHAMGAAVKALFSRTPHREYAHFGEPGLAVSTNDHLPAAELAISEQRLLETWAKRCAESQSRPEPIVTVVIPVFNHLDATVRCLQSIADTWFDSLCVQVVVVDDASTDRTSQVLPQVRGIDYVRCADNRGFVHACNRGAALARGHYVCFLNNDTVVRDAWLDYLVSAAEDDPTIGAIGSKLIYPNGTLQEAGGIIWRDATGWNYGRNGDPRDPACNFRRDVDYCSGAALMVRRDLFELLGGFSTMYAPAYYEDADLCFAVRSLGYRVVYEPRSEVVHFEGISSGTEITSGAKRYQEINRPKFREKWLGVLAQHYENDPAVVPQAARRLNGFQTILFIDSYVPLHDRESGSNRLLALLRIMREARYNVVFLPDNYAAIQPYTRQLQALGIEVLHHTDDGISADQALDRVLPVLDGAWICRPELFAKYAPRIRRNKATKLFYDTIDLHFVRKRREVELLGGDPEEWQRYEREELAAAREADATIVVTEDERDVLLRRGIENVYVVPNAHEPHSAVPTFSDSKGLLFIGGYNHPPNVDAAIWLCEEIMPDVWKALPDLPVTLLGSSPPDAVLALQSHRVHVPGYIPDVTSYFCSHRLFVAPLRYGAGMKGKVGQALAHALPSVLTPVAAEGFDLQNERDCLIADDAKGFARAIVRLYRDERLWTTFSEQSSRVIEPFGKKALGPHVISMVTHVLKSRDLQAAG